MTYPVPGRIQFTINLGLVLFCGIHAQNLLAQDLQKQLAGENVKTLSASVEKLGDAKRGAVLFYQPYMACASCHTSVSGQPHLGPMLSAQNPSDPDQPFTIEFLIESVLDPSKVVRKGFETNTIETFYGKKITGLLVQENDSKVVLRDPAKPAKLIEIELDDIADRITDAPSVMPTGLVNQLASRQQFLDLIAYLKAIADGGPQKELELKPADSLFAVKPLPEYEANIDHAGIITTLDAEAFKRGEAIYNRLCVNCHGTKDQPGSLPTSLRFSSGIFKSGNDPHTMYQTLTKGFGMMMPQTWMVPQQKYDVIHYIREQYLKTDNPSQYFSVDADYLAGLPKGDTRGPEPSEIVPWEQMNYGPNLIATYEIGSDASNFAYKGNAIRLDSGPGGVSQGNSWIIYDYDTMRVAAVWTGKQFIDYHGINFDGRHGIHPRITGTVHVANPTGPGWADPNTGSFIDDKRIVGRDDRIYGPLPRNWAHYKGMYSNGNQTVISYSVGQTAVLELPGAEPQTNEFTGKRTFNIGPRDRDMILQVAKRSPGSQLIERGPNIIFGQAQPGTVQTKTKNETAKTKSLVFDGKISLEVANGDAFEMRDKDYTIYAKFKTNKDASIFTKTAPHSEWIANGETLFVRGGKLVFDIGWVGALVGKKKVTDGKWHEVAITYQADSGRTEIFVDGEKDASGILKAKKKTSEHVIRIGYTSDDFPIQGKKLRGSLSNIAFIQKKIEDDEIGTLAETAAKHELAVAAWDFSNATSNTIADSTGNEHDANVIIHTNSVTSQTKSEQDSLLAAGIAGTAPDVQWISTDQGDLRLRIPAGKLPLKFTLWMSNINEPAAVDSLTETLVLDGADQDLSEMTGGGPLRWPESLKVKTKIGATDGPFAIDELVHPESNPWFCRMRLTGFDFLADGDRVAVSDWDGNVWMVSGLSRLDSGESETELTWRRIASGMFQPLGVKVIDEKIYVTCRDELCLLHDLNGDGEIDFYQNYNNDHQVTDHFHEFAMGLQTDDEGNFYYAKSARHALTAVVPHHGTLLKISKDGSKTEILANGFRAANGVCVNPDGTFIVTDQEGHWNPKNRINWVEKGGFYGNMFGYHDVTDDSDEAMQQPLCWITNAFDRSPAELMWIDSERWGPLNGSLLNFSYGYGKVYIVPHEKLNGQVQGGMCQLPIPQFETGVMRGRFHPKDGQLYTCGMFAWAGSQTSSGGFYRIRYTGQDVHLPVGLEAKENGISLTFSGELATDPNSTDRNTFNVKTWSLQRTRNYGSKHFDEKNLEIKSTKVSSDGRSVFLEIPEIDKTWCMEIKYSIQASSGKPISGTIHNTIHHLGKAD